MGSDVLIIKGGERYFLRECFSGIKLSGLKREAPDLEQSFVQFEGSDGNQISNERFNGFLFTTNFAISVNSYQEAALFTTEFQHFLIDKQLMYLVNPNEPGKRYRVRVAIDYEQVTSRFINGTINFYCYRGHGESSMKTLDSNSVCLEWQVSQGLVSEDYKYIHNTSRFVIFNAGDFTIDPREHDLRIRVEGESDGQMTIFNRTTGERFIYRPNFSANRGDWVELDGVYPRRNGVNRGIDTNHGLITLVPGENDIEIQNISRVRSVWDFRFLYK